MQFAPATILFVYNIDECRPVTFAFCHSPAPIPFWAEGWEGPLHCPGAGGRRRTDGMGQGRAGGVSTSA